MDQPSTRHSPNPLRIYRLGADLPRFHGAGGAEPDEDDDEGATKTCNTPEDFAEASSEGQQREQS